MASNTENQYGDTSNEANAAAAGGSWGAAPPIMHSWCLQPDAPSVQSESKSQLTNDAEDDCGFDLNLGLSLGGGKSTKSKSKEKEKEVVLDRDTFREKEPTLSKDSSVPEEAPHGGVMFKVLKSEQGAGNPRVQSFWQDLDRSGNEAKEKAAAFPPHQTQSPISNPEHQQQQPVEASNWAGVNSVAEDSKMFAQHMWQALQGKAAQPEHQRVPLSARDEASLIKELQGLPPQAVATAAAWARVVAQGGFPMQLLEAIKDGVDPQGLALQRSKSLHSEVAAIPVASSPAMSAGPSGDHVERSDSDVSKNMQMDHRQAAITQQQELIEQQRKREIQTQKRQELRRKRKAALEGQKSKKTSKKEEERSKSGSGLDSPPNNQLRRTSSLQQPLPAASKENSLSTVSSPPDSSQDATGGASSMSAFRRPGNSSWLHNREGGPQMAAAKGDAEKLQHGGAADGRVDPAEQTEIRRARDRGTKDHDSNAQVDSSGESRKLGSPDVVQMQRMDLDSGSRRLEGSGLGPPPVGQIDPAWIQKIMEVQMNTQQLAAMMESNRELAGKTGFPPLQKRGDHEKAHHPAPKAEQPAKRGRRGASESSSAGTESSGGQDEKTGRAAVHGDAEALSSPAVIGNNGSSAAGEGGRPNSVNNNSAAVPSLGNAVAMANMAFPPGGGFPMMPGPFPFPLPMPPGGGAGGVPFSMPFPFPYVMQFAPGPSGNGGDGSSSNPEQQQRGHPGMASPFQISLPAGFNPPFQIQTPEGAAAWASAAVVRPHAATPPQSPPRNGAPAKPPGQSGLSREEEKQHGSSRGVKGGNELARNRNAPIGGGEPSSSPSAPTLVRSNSLGSGAFNRLRTSPTGAPANAASPLAPQFGIMRSKSEAVALRREGSVGSAFASLGDPPHGQGNNSSQMSSERAKQGSSAATAASAGGTAPRPEQPGVVRGAAAAAAAEEEGPAAGRGGPAAAAAAAEVVSAAQSTSSSAEDPVRRGLVTGVWRQGSLPSFEGMGGHEASSLRPGVAPGVHFGGTGSPPDLPWVTCNGTISGVLYRVEKGQVRIVCACHGRHMTPAEFVQHAGCGEIPNPEKAIVVGPFTVLAQQPASAQA